ncbi:hypothetical protein V8F20_006859 [Naviculisporaceae sp. PSN 640]
MRFATISATLVAVLSATPVLASLPATCNHDQLYADEPGGSQAGCIWKVCVNGNSYREVRNCGAGGRCKTGQPTTCVDKSGRPY